MQIDHRPYLREVITVPAGSPATTIELLARWPGTLDFLYRMAAREGTDVRFTVQVDGGPVRELTFAEVVEGSRALKQLEQPPRHQESRIEFLDPKATPRPPRSLASKSLVVDNVCAAGCQQQCDTCQPEDCLTRDPCDTCDACTSQYNSCIESCPVCVPDVSYYQTSAQLVGGQGMGSECTGNADYSILVADHQDPQESDPQVEGSLSKGIIIPRVARRGGGGGLWAGGVARASPRIDPFKRNHHPARKRGGRR